MDINEQKNKLLDLVHEALAQDKALREKYQIADKFRFIRDHLQTLVTNVEESLKATEVEKAKKVDVTSEDEMLVYVYLFNTHGIMLNTWLKMLQPEIFYEHSVNRPVYTEKSHIEGLIKRKATKVQHAYLTIVMKKSDVSAAEGAVGLKDIYDNPVIKVKEGALAFKNMVAFTHNDQDYEFNSDGELVKKQVE